MRTRIRYFGALTFLAILGEIGCGRVERGPALYSIVASNGAPAGTPRMIAGAETATEIRIDPQVLAAEPPALSLPLSDGRTLSATRDRIATAPRTVSWIGTVTGKPGNPGLVQIISHANGTSAIVSAGDERYEIHPKGTDGSILFKMKSGGAAGASIVASAPQQQQATMTTVCTTPITPGEIVTLDVLALYSEELLGDEPAVLAFIDSSIAVANAVFFNSGVPAQYRLIDARPLTGSQPPAGQPIGGVEYRLGAAVSWLAADPMEVVALRDSYGADVVTLFLPLPEPGTDPEACSGGLIALKTPDFAERAYSVHRKGCGLGDFSLAHALGANFGMRHTAQEAADPNSLFSFAAGYDFPAGPNSGLTTVMGCQRTVGDITGAVCNRIAEFSTPKASWNGVPAGDANHRNADVAITQAPCYAAFRSTQTDGVPVVRISSPARRAAVPASSFRASATALDPEDGDLSARIAWSSDREGNLGLVGSSVEVTLLMGGPHILTATVADKAARRLLPVEPDYAVVAAPDRFLVGYGLDYRGRYRNLPDLWAVDGDDLVDRPDRHVTALYGRAGSDGGTLAR